MYDANYNVSIFFNIIKRVRMNDIVEVLLENATRLITQCESRYQRYFAKAIDYEQKMIGLVGARGVGKTTAILQHLQILAFFLTSIPSKLYLHTSKLVPCLLQRG